MKIIQCPVCGVSTELASKKYKPILVDGHRYEIVQCKSCSHHYTYFHEDVDVNVYYDALDYSVTDTRKSIFHKIQALEYLRVIKSLRDLKNGDSLLDFGCGKGVFLSFAKNSGYKVAGVETSMPRAQYAKFIFDVSVNTKLFDKGRIFDQKFDTISMFHVLEHIPHANLLLQNLYSDNLKDNGVAIIEVPNLSSWQSRWAKGRWLHIDVPRHVSHFTNDSLKKLIDSSGLQVVKQSTFSWHLGIIGMLQTLMNFAGYKGFLIGDLKQRKTSILLVIAILLPFALSLELLAAIVGKGGIIRFYLVKKNIHENCNNRF